MSTSINYLTRPGTPEDAETILTVDLRAFGRTVAPAEWARAVEAKRVVAPHYRVLEADGRIVGVVQVAPHRLRLGRAAEVLKGDVGGVAVLPECQGQGYGATLMCDVTASMRSAGYHLSRLGGYARFYARFGYEPFPRRHVLFPVGPVRAGASVIPAEEVYRLPADLPGRLRPYDATRDVMRQGELRELFDGARSGAFLRDREAEARLAANPQSVAPDPLRIVYEVDGTVQGCALAHVADPNPHVSQLSVTVSDLAVNPAYPDALIALVKYILNEACRRSVPLVMIRMPFDEASLAVLRAERIEFRLVEQNEGVASNMVQILNLESLLRAAAPELTANLADAGLDSLLPTLALEIAVNGQRVGLEIAHGAVRVAPVSAPDARLELGQATLVKLLFGLTTFAEAVIPDKVSFSPAARAALTGLFPRQAYSGSYALG